MKIHSDVHYEDTCVRNYWYKSKAPQRHVLTSKKDLKNFYFFFLKTLFLFSFQFSPRTQIFIYKQLNEL
jgi:hypothetical protein